MKEYQNQKMSAQVSTWEAKIYMAGDIWLASTKLREICMRGLCVTLTKTTYIYTGGAEDGFIVGLINYPRFPSTVKALKNKSVGIGIELAKHCCQNSFSISFPDKTIFFKNGVKK